MPHRFSRSGIALADLIATTLGIAVLAGGIGTAIDRAKEAANRVRCAQNLRQIGQALLLYGNENRGAYPSTRRANPMGGKPVFFTNWKAADPMKDDGPEFNDVTAALFLLVRTQDLKSTVFQCPSTDATSLVFGDAPVGDVKPVAKSPGEISNFPDPKYLSYSYSNPYPGAIAVGAGFKFNTGLPADFAVAGDINPGGESLAPATPDTMPPAEPNKPARQYAPNTTKPVTLNDAQKMLNSPNHGGEGQNVLYADGAVYWQPTPFCGQPRPDGKRDNIFTRHLADVAKNKAEDPILGPPMDPYDSIFLPTAPAVKPKQS